MEEEEEEERECLTSLKALGSCVLAMKSAMTVSDCFKTVKSGWSFGVCWQRSWGEGGNKVAAPSVTLMRVRVRVTVTGLTFSTRE